MAITPSRSTTPEMVRDFLWAQHNTGRKEVHVLVDALQNLRSQGKAGGTGGLQFSPVP